PPARGRPPGGRLAPEPRALSARDERPRHLRRRRCAGALDQARGERGRGGIDGGLADPRVPGERMSEPVSLTELRTVDLFDDLEDEQLAEWVGVTSVESCEPGTVIFEQGVEPPGLKLLLEGEAIAPLVEGARTEPGGRPIA